MDHYLRIIESMMGNGVTLSSQLNRIGKKLIGERFRGVYAADTIPQLHEYQMVLANLDDSDEPGSHWIAIYRHGGRTYVYDSFGRNIQSIIKLDMPFVSALSAGNRQKPYETNCGQRSLAMLLLFKRFGATPYFANTQ